MKLRDTRALSAAVALITAEHGGVDIDADAVIGDIDRESVIVAMAKVVTNLIQHYIEPERADRALRAFGETFAQTPGDSR